MRTKIVIIILILFLAPTITLAGDIVINEIAWMGTIASGNDEWIELYNNSDNEINLEGWLLKSSDESIKISLSGKISAQGFFLLERTDDQTVPGISADLIYKGSLANSGENIILTNGQDNIVYQIDCSNGWTAGDNITKQTMERNLSISSGQAGWQNSANPGGTPRETNSIKQMANSETTNGKEIITNSKERIANSAETKQVQEVKNIFINEIMPSPEGSDEQGEWIEIFNNNNFAADIANWQIRDIVGQVRTYTFPIGTKISAFGFLVLTRPQSKITLQNTQDGLELLNPGGQVIQSISYSSAKQGQTYSRVNNNTWYWSQIPTPGSVNHLPPKIQNSNISSSTDKNQTAAFLNLSSSETKKLDQSKTSQNKKWPIFLVAILIAFVSSIIVFSLAKKENARN